MKTIKKLLSIALATVMLTAMMPASVFASSEDEMLLDPIDAVVEEELGQQIDAVEDFSNSMDISPDSIGKDDIIASLEKQGYLYLSTSGNEFTVYADAEKTAEVCKVVNEGTSVLLVDGYDNDMIHVLFADQFGSIIEGYIGIGNFTLLTDEVAAATAEFFSMKAVQVDSRTVYSTVLFVEEETVADATNTEEDIVNNEPSEEEIVVDIVPDENIVDDNDTTEEVVVDVPVEKQEEIINTDDNETVDNLINEENVTDTAENKETDEEVTEDIPVDENLVVDVEPEEDKNEETNDKSDDTTDNIEQENNIYVAPEDEQETDVPNESVTEEITSEENEDKSPDVADEQNEEETASDETADEKEEQASEEQANPEEVTDEAAEENPEEDPEEEIIDINPEYEEEITDGCFVVIKEGSPLYDCLFDYYATSTRDTIAKVLFRTLDNDGNDVYMVRYWCITMDSLDGKGVRLFADGAVAVENVSYSYETDYSMMDVIK